MTRKQTRKSPTQPRTLTAEQLTTVTGGAGHARYGSGPDFDDKHDNSGNNFTTGK